MNTRIHKESCVMRVTLFKRADRDHRLPGRTLGSNRLTVALATLAAVTLLASGLPLVTPATFAAPEDPPAAVSLGTIQTQQIAFGVYARNLFSTGITHFDESVILTTGTATGFDVSGSGADYGMQTGMGAYTIPILADMRAAYADASGRTATGSFDPIPDDGSQTFTPGVYSSGGSSLTLGENSTITFDGEGKQNAVFIVQVDGDLTMGAGTRIILTGGAHPQNVFWQVNGTATVGADSVFVGVVLAKGDITMGANTPVAGRLITETDVYTNNNQFTSRGIFLNFFGPSVYKTHSHEPAISGYSSGDCDKVELTVGGISYPASYCVMWWSYLPYLPDGIYPMVATTADGMIAAYQTLIIDNVAPDAPEITGGPIAFTNLTKPPITGTAEPGSKVVVNVCDRVFTVTTAADGTWSVSLASSAPLPQGECYITAFATDATGNEGPRT